MPWDRPDVASAFTLEEAAQRLGSYRWVELRLYEAMGSWVDTIGDLDVRLAVGSGCTIHAWHASVWLDRLPAGRDPEALTRPATEGVSALLDRVASAADPLERLVGAYRVVVPRLVAAYTAHLNHTSAAADAPTARALGLVLADEVAAWREGELLVQSLIVSAADARRAADHQARIEALIVGAGGLAGAATLRPRG
jgi:hypothetical protein